MLQLVALLSWLLISFRSGCCYADNWDYYSSITGLEELLQTEHILLEDFSNQLTASKTQLEQLESELSAIKLEHALAENDTENYLTNPVNVYRLMKRLHVDWQQLELRLQQMGAQLEFSPAERTELSFPSQEDVDGAALALVRLQSTYKLDVAQVAAGILNGIKYGTAMSWQDCFMLGQQLFEMQDYNNTKAWLRESMQRLRSRQPRQRALEADTLNSMELVAKSLFQMGDFDTAYELSRRVLEYDPKRIRNWHLGDKTAQLTDVDMEADLWHADLPAPQHTYSQTHEFAQYEKVCRGEVSASAAQQRALRCRYTQGHHAYGLLAPYKLEEHSLDPLVVSYHDMLSAQRIHKIRQMAVPHMQRSLVNPVPGKLQHKKTAFRVSKNAWLDYSRHSIMRGMLRDLQHATGLDMTYCEQLQVANYGVGGHYEPHWDFFRDERHYPAVEGNRIATAIYYLSDVEQGGATAFPFFNFAVRPQLGSVLFWYNLHRSLDVDYRTKHAGCPVLKGSKWIANIWIHEATQTFARPCGMHRDNEISLDYQFIK